jgi:alpha,alpha-trehalose phosphorylase
MFRGRLLLVEVRHGSATYTLAEGEPLEVLHYEEPFVLSPDHPVVRDVPEVPHTGQAEQPPGRAPRRRAAPPATVRVGGHRAG